MIIANPADATKTQNEEMRTNPVKASIEAAAATETTVGEEDDANDDNMSSRVTFQQKEEEQHQGTHYQDWGNMEQNLGAEDPAYERPKVEEGILTKANDHNTGQTKVRGSMTSMSLFANNPRLKALYGRETEIQQIRQAYQRMKEPPHHSQAVFLGGFSGSGKTALVDEAMDSIQKHEHIVQSNHNTQTKDNISTRRINKYSSQWIVRGKYDEMRTPLPYKGLSEAFARWYKSLTSKEKSVLIPHVQNKLYAAVGNDAESLVEILPALSKLITGYDADDDESVNGTLSNSKQGTVRTQVTSGGFDHLEKISKHRLQFAFRTLLSILVEQADMDIVLFVDDLQWADVGSLELIESLLSYTGSTHNEPPVPRFLFIGSYRSNEVPPTHPLALILERLPKSRPPNASLQVINLSDLALEQVQAFIADALNKPPKGRRISALAKAIFAKTMGNMFFTKEALEALVRQKAIICDGKGQWDWRMNEQELVDALPGDIQQVVRSKIDALSPEIRRILVVASYTRSTFDVDTLVVLLNSTQSLWASMLETKQEPSSSTMVMYTTEQLTIHLDQAVADGLLTAASNNRKTHNLTSSHGDSEVEDISSSHDESQHSYHSKEYSFAHDRITEQVSQIISGKELERLKFELGNALVDRSIDNLFGEDWMLFVGMHHLNSLPPELFDTAAMADMQIKMARLNLKAAEESTSKAAFDVAAEFAAKGIDFLPADCWKSQPQLSHDLYSVAAEASRLTGCTEDMERYCRVCLGAEKDRPEGSKFQVYYTLAQGLCYGEGRYEEAKKIYMDLLDHLGCRLPRTSVGKTSSVLYNVLKLALNKTNWIKDVNDMPFMTDPNKMNAMKLLSKMGDVCYHSEDEELMTVCLFRCMDYTLKHGVSPESPRPVAAMAVLFSSVLNQLKGAGECADFGMRLMEKADYRPSQPGSYFFAYWAGFPWVKYIGECVEPLRQGYTIGIKTESSNDASWCILFSLVFAMQAGNTSLLVVDQEWSKTLAQVEAASQPLHIQSSLAAWKCTSNLCGLQRDVSVDWESAVAKKKPLFYSLKVMDLYEFTFLGNYKEAADFCVKHKNGFRAKNPGNPLAMMDSVVGALSCYDQYYKTKKMEYKREGKRRHTLISGWAKQGNPNVIHWKHLLDAEVLSAAEYKKSPNNASVAEDMYRKAVRLALKGGFKQDAALFYERWALHALKTPVPNKLEQATKCLHESFRLFQKWGAMGKVRVMKEQYPTFYESFSGKAEV